MNTKPMAAYTACFCHRRSASPAVAEYTAKRPMTSSAANVAKSTLSGARESVSLRFIDQVPPHKGSGDGSRLAAAAAGVLEHHRHDDAGIVERRRAHEQRVGQVAVGVLGRAGL